MHKPKIQIGREDMSRSAHTFLPKNKLVAGMGIGAIAMLAMAGPALTDDNEHGNSSKKDEMFKVTTVMQVPVHEKRTAGLLRAPRPRGPWVSEISPFAVALRLPEWRPAT